MADVITLMRKETCGEFWSGFSQGFHLLKVTRDQSCQAFLSHVFSRDEETFLSPRMWGCLNSECEQALLSIEQHVARLLGYTLQFPYEAICIRDADTTKSWRFLKWRTVSQIAAGQMQMVNRWNSSVSLSLLLCWWSATVVLLWNMEVIME